MATTGKNKKIHVSLTTIDDSRLPLYPVGRPKQKAVIQTSWGEVWFDKGVPNARQRDILDAIAVCALATKKDAVGRKCVLFDAVEVCKLLKSDDWHWLKTKLEELQTTQISVRQPGSEWGQSYTVLNIVGDSPVDAVRKGAQYPTKLKKIIYSELMTALLEQDVLVYMKPEITKAVLFLQHQVSRSFARWNLSHSTHQHHQLTSVLKAIGCTGGERNIRRYKAQLRDDQEGLKNLGIEIKGDVCHYTRQITVWFKNGKTEQVPAGSGEERNTSRLEPEQVSAGNGG